MKDRKKCRIPFMDEMDEVFGDTVVGSTSSKLSISRVRPSSTMLLSKLDRESSPDEDDDDDDNDGDEDDDDNEADGENSEEAEDDDGEEEQEDPMDTENTHIDANLDPKEAGRNARFERKLKFIEKLEKRREKIKERRFQELLMAIKQSRK